MAMLLFARCLESLRKHATDEPLAREVDALARLLESSLAMADELLVDNQAKEPVGPIDVNDVIAGLCDVIQAIVGPNIRVETTLARGETRVYARRVDLDRIVLNLVCNAAAAMPSNGLLVIETSRIPPANEDPARFPDAPFGRLRLTIADTGYGVPLRQVWQVRDSAQLPRPDGSGIGLSSVSLILLRLGGQFEIGGREGEGAVVEVRLPLAAPACERIH